MYGREDVRAARNLITARAFRMGCHPPEVRVKGILLWLIGIPIPIILLLWLLGVLH